MAAPSPLSASRQKESRVPKNATSPKVANQKDNKDKPRRSYLDKQLRKTKICMYHLRGACQYSTNCDFAHTASELQGLPDLSNTRLCKAFAQGECTDRNCGFAHGEDELRSTNLFFKKTLCIWNEKGKCRNGDQCRFAHGNVELRYASGVAAEGMKNMSTKEKTNAKAKTLGGPTPPSNRAPQTRRQENLQADMGEQQLQEMQQLLMELHLQQQLQLQGATAGGVAAAYQSSNGIRAAEPMKVQSSLADAATVDTNPYDPLKEQLDQMKQLMSVLSLKCNQIQSQVDSGCGLKMQQGVHLPPGLDVPLYA